MHIHYTVYFGQNFVIKKIPDYSSGSAAKNSSIFNPKNCLLLPWSRILMPRISDQDPQHNKHGVLQSSYALLWIRNYSICFVSVSVSDLGKFRVWLQHSILGKVSDPGSIFSLCSATASVSYPSLPHWGTASPMAVRAIPGLHLPPSPTRYQAESNSVLRACRFIQL
jgi:hypothetical protein